ncbi:MAG: Rhamnolipids biosynthesis 3-oxoacyl-[acyl-carrier-protein] reductase [archaeon]|jgi:NAD(P)-dependent dehydrogenase (short-subunit alcohol dehydrogenase family)
MAGKVCVVTGANSGMGKIIAFALANQGATVIMVCRIKEKSQIAFHDIKSKTKNDNVELMLTDLSSQKEVRELAEKIKMKYPKIDVLINNAGGMNFGYSETVDHIETTFATNHLAYFLLTHLLLENLKSSKNARIINVASEASKNAEIHFEDVNLKNSYTAFKAYSQSKLANIMFTYELAKVLEKTNSKNVTVNCVHPGNVPDTKLGKGSKLFANFIASLDSSLIVTPEKGAETILWLATSEEVEGITGKYFQDKKEIKSNNFSYNKEASKKLWDLSKKMSGMNF